MMTRQALPKEYLTVHTHVTLRDTQTGPPDGQQGHGHRSRGFWPRSNGKFRAELGLQPMPVTPWLVLCHRMEKTPTGAGFSGGPIQGRLLTLGKFSTEAE